MKGINEILVEISAEWNMYLTNTLYNTNCNCLVVQCIECLCSVSPSEHKYISGTIPAVITSGTRISFRSPRSIHPVGPLS